MGWTAKEIDELRKGKNGTAGSTAGSSSAHSSTAAGSRSTGTGSGWTPEKIDALRGGSTGKRTTEAWENRSAGTSTETRRARTNTGSSQSSTGGSLGGQVLAQMMGSTNPKLQLEVPGSGTQSERNGTRGGTEQPEWLGKAGSSTPAAQVRGTVKPTEKKRQPYAATGGTMQLQSGYGAVNSAPNADALKQTIAAGDGKRVDWYARTAQEAKEDFAKNSEPDRFDELNQWMDADPKHRELVNLIRGGTGEQQPYVQRGNAMQAQDGTGAMASAPTAQSTGRRDYTDAELQAKGYTQTEINEAKAYIRDFDALPAWQRAVRRTSNTIGGIAEEIAAGGLQMGENAVQAVKNSSVTKKNRDALKESLAGDARQEKLFKLVDTVDSNGSPKYSDAELIAKGYTQGEIDDMRSRYAATEVKDAVDPEKSVGYQLHKRSQDLTGAALSGLSPLAQKALGIVSSAGENLVVASIDPAMVLPVLSLQGAGESMGQSVEKGDSAGKTLAGGALKFGAGWAINSVGAADLAKTMGTDYAKDTLAGKLADLVRSVADNGPMAQQYPVIANAVSGGVDNAMQAFVETYADMAIDAALGDSDAAQNLFKKDTFLNAVESGLTGGASGALGGAVGTGLGKMNARFDAAAGGPLSPLQSGDAGAAAELSRGESLPQRNAEQEESAHAASPQQSPSATASPEGEALSPADMQAQQAESGQGYSVSLSNDTMTVRFADGTETVQKVDLEDPKTLLFDPEQLHRQAQAESQAAQQNAVENTGETVESSPAEQHSGLRETYGLTQQSRSVQQRQVQQELTRWKVSDTASETISKNMPVGIGDAERYAAAASSLYRLGQMEDVTTFDKAMELAQGMNGLAVNTEYVLAQDGGRQALQLAWLQGHGEMEAGSMQRGTLGGELTEKSTSGSGRVLYKGTMRTANDVGTQLIELNARATDTDAVLKTVLQGNDRVKAYVDTEVAQIYFADSAEDVFGTILHEDYHWYNSLDAEGAQALQQHALEFLAKSEGYEDIDAMIREKAADYAQQGLTYEQAAEELVADAWRGIFSDEASFKRWVEFQRQQAEKNAGRAGTIRKVMNKVKELLSDIVSRAKEVLAKDPENKAALRAQRLAEAEKRVLQDEYFAHAEKAMDSLRSAKENAAALENKGTAEGTRFKLHEDSESLTEQMNDHLGELEEMEPVAEIRGNEVNFGKNARENVENIDAFFDSIGNKVERENFGIVELKHYGANKTVRHGNSAAKQAAVAAIPGVIRNGNQIGYEKNWQGKGYDTYVFAGPVIMDETRINEAVIVNSYTREDGRKAFYTHEVCWSDGSYVTFDDAGKPTKKEDTPTHLPMDVRSSAMAAQEVSSDTSIAQETAENKGNNGTLKKNIRLQLAAPVEVDTQKDLVAVHNLTEQNLQEALELGGMPSPSIAVVKAQEGHTKYGPISLVFGSDTIDPMANSANRIYGSDAWTPTRPNVEYEVKADKARELNTYLAQLSRQTAEGEFARGNVLSGTLDMEASDKSPQQLAEQLAHNDAAKAAYLADRGENVDVVMKQEQRFTESQISRYEKVTEAVGGKENLREIIETDRANGNHDMANAVLEEVRSAEKNWAMQELGWDAEKAEKKAAKLIAPMLRVRLENAYEYATTEDTGGKMVQDTDAMRQTLQEKAPDADVEKWLLPKIEKILGKKGIYNGKELFTRNGNRRSFAQLHNPYTLENLVNAMNQEDARGKGAWGLSANTLMSTATAEYETLEDVRADKDRLQQIPKEEYKTLLEKADSQIEDVVARLRRETTPHTSSSYEEREIIGDVLLRAAQGKRTSTTIAKAFAKEGYSISKDTAQVILNLYNDVAQIPTGYFEAKPQRAVRFDEVRAAILPDNASKSLIAQLKDTGVPVELYKAGDDAERTKLLNEVPNVRFQLAEQADRDAKRNDQQTASRAIADKAAALDTLSQFFGLTRGVKVSQSAIEGLASRWAKANGSRVDRAKLARETEVLVEYLKADGADMEKGQALSETLAGEILDGATYRNSELWDEYPELHKLEYTVNKTGQAKAELVKAYGSWSAAVAEARKHGVSLRQAEGVRDGNPVEQYDSVINDNRAVGGTSDGAKALWKAAAQQAGVDGAMSMESTEWLSVLMNLHDAIKPTTQSRFADDAEYEDAKVELAGRIIGDILNTPEMTDAQAIFEGIQQHNLQVAKAAAGSEERAAEVEKGLKGVQKAQQREFNRRMYENRRAANQSAEVQQMTELQRQNAQAEKLLDENLETLGVDTSNVGNLNEKLTFLRESYEREMKQEVKRMKAERQEMLDEAKLEMQKLRSEKNELAWQLRQEKQRADKAEYSLLVQENEIMEWEADNERKRAAFEQKQAQRNAVAIETARQQRDEDIAIAKAVAEKRVQRARDARKMDELKRSIRQNAAQLNQMLLRPSKDKYVQKNLVDAAAQVAKLADMTILNERAVNQLTRLQDRIRQSAGSENSPNAMTEEWKQTGVDTLIQTLWDDLQTTKDAKLTKLHEQLAEAEVLPDSEKAWALQERLRKRIKETENRTYLPMTVDQMRMLKAITSSTLHVIKNANKTVSLAKAEEVSKIAEGAASEVNASKGNHPGGKLDGVHNLLTKYQLDMLGAERVFRMLGGYAKNGQMEKMAQMLNDGQYRQTKITVEGEKLFANVTGKEHVKEMQNFAGPGADLVDVGLTDVKGKKAKLTHAQLCSLYMHLHNTDSLNHLMNGGLVIPDAKLYNKGDIEQAYQKGQTVHLGMLTDADGTPTADSILQTVEAAMTDYDRAWCADMKEFFDHYTTNLINETSLQLVGYQRATVKNYYPIAVDRSVLATQIEGLNLDATIEGRGFLKNRVKSSQPILLEECANVVQHSLRDTADYAGLAAPIRDVQKILNSGVETREGLKNLKNGIIKEQWGGDAVNYIDNLLKDLQKKSRQRKSTLQWLGNLSSKYAGAVLTLNPGVALAQAASLPTAAAVLGGDTVAAVVPFVKNASPKQRAALEAEIKAHGDVLLDWRKRGSQNGELASIGKQKTLAEKGMDKLPNWLTGWINGMDEVTVAALWEGSKRYVQNHTAEFEGAEVTGSPAYWEAVNRTYQKVIEQTQPNYTVMQRAGIQRNPDGMAKALTMFTTQRFQNYGILADAVGDYKAQAERYRAESSAENKAEVQRAGQQLRRAVASQTVQTVTFALMKMSVGFVLHRWKDLQDENGDMTLKSLLKRLGELCMESFAGTGLYGSEIYGFASNAVTGNDYDVVSAANLGLVNEFAAAAGKFAYELRKDIGGMDEDEAEKHDRKLWTLAGNVVEAGLQALGVPYANGKKFVEAAVGWYGTLQDWKKNGKYGNFDSLPQSATGQYDRLYNAYASGDSDEAKAAVEKLNEMGKGEDVYKQLKTRLVKYDANVKAAAEAQNAGDDQKRYELEMQMIEQLSDALRLPKGKRGDVVDCVTGAVNQLADKLLKGDNSSATDDLVEAVDSWDASAVQEEYDRLAKAGKSASTLKGKITETAKPEYLAGSDADRQQMETMLLALVDADGKALYTEKTFAQWVKAADKAESEEKKDPYAAVR